MAKTILLADDSVTIQKVVELTFMDEDYQVVATGDGTSALERLAEIGPDLVIADVHMPGADGYEVCRQTKERHPGIPVLLLVGTFEQFDEQQAAAVGADGHLKKPFDSTDLLSQVETLIARFGSEEPPAIAASPAPPAPAPPAPDIFAPDDDLTPVADLEPPPLEAPAAPAEDIWSTESSQVSPSAFESIPAVEPEPSTFATSEAPDLAAPAFGADLGQDVTDTAAIGVDAASAALGQAEEPAFEVEAVTEELPEVVPMTTPEPEAVAPVPEESPFDLEVSEAPVSISPEPAAPEPALDLEAPSLEAPALDAPSFGAVEAPALDAPSFGAVEPLEVESIEEPEPSEAIAPEASPAEAPESVEPATLAEPEPEAAEPEATEPEAVAPTSAEPAGADANGSGPLSEDDVERIARRVAELMGEKALRDVAWEVVPDLAEVIIKERIRELESQVV